MTISEYRLNLVNQVFDYYCDRLTHLVDENELDDAHAIYSEFVVDDDEPDQWAFLPFIENEV